MASNGLATPGQSDASTPSGVSGLGAPGTPASVLGTTPSANASPSLAIMPTTNDSASVLGVGSNYVLNQPFMPFSGGSMLGGDSQVQTFVCTCCKKTLPKSDGMPKGGSWICYKDNTSYNSLVTRWNKNPKLKTWWQALPPVAKQNWYIKWQGMGTKQRFDSIVYQESTLSALELVDDEVDEWIPFNIYFSRNQGRPGVTWQSLHIEFTEEVNGNRLNCRFHRGEWHIPVNAGLQRRTRRKITHEIGAHRSASIEDANQLQELNQGGIAQLQRFKAGLQPVATSRLGITEFTSQARPEDMPQLAPPRDILMDAICREAIRHSYG